MSSCPGCNTENPAGSKFCAGCGAALPKTPLNVRCSMCGTESPEGSRFCKGCGKAGRALNARRRPGRGRTQGVEPDDAEDQDAPQRRSRPLRSWPSS